MTEAIAGKAPFVSVIVPTWNEVATLPAALLSARDPSAEIIVVDGGSSDGTVDLAARSGVCIVRAPRGRGKQLAAGARAAAGQVLLFLHADAVLPRGYVAEVRRALSGSGCALGAFRLSIDGDGWALRVIERGANWRSRWLKMPYGDQALFLRASTYRSAGGFSELEAMEDIELVRRVRRLGRVRTMESPVLASARSWVRHGTLRFTWCNLLCALGFALGVPTARIAGWRARCLSHGRRAGGGVAASHASERLAARCCGAVPVTDARRQAARTGQRRVRGARRPGLRVFWRVMGGLVLLAMLGAWLVNRAPEPLPEAPARLEIEVDGLDCAFWCAVGVEAALAAVPGTRVDRVDTSRGIVFVSFDPKRASADAIVQRIASRWSVRSAQVSLPGTGVERSLTVPLPGAAKPGLRNTSHRGT